MHLWPVVPNPPHIAPSTARSMFASSITMITFLPPSSSPTLFNPASFVIICPVSTLPVKLIPRIFSCFTRGIPTLVPGPVTMFKTPFGTPAFSKISTSLIAQRGVSLAGLKTMVLPVMRAGAIFHAGIAIGKFHGVIKATIPTGRLMVMQNLSGSSLGVVCP